MKKTMFKWSQGPIFGLICPVSGMLVGARCSSFDFFFLLVYHFLSFFEDYFFGGAGWCDRRDLNPKSGFVPANLQYVNTKKAQTLALSWK